MKNNLLSLLLLLLLFLECAYFSSLSSCYKETPTEQNKVQYFSVEMKGTVFQRADILSITF